MKRARISGRVGRKHPSLARERLSSKLAAGTRMSLPSASTASVQRTSEATSPRAFGPLISSCVLLYGEFSAGETDLAAGERWPGRVGAAHPVGGGDACELDLLVLPDSGPRAPPEYSAAHRTVGGANDRAHQLPWLGSPCGAETQSLDTGLLVGLIRTRHATKLSIVSVQNTAETALWRFLTVSGPRLPPCLIVLACRQ
jgi:hypothetical protein